MSSRLFPPLQALATVSVVLLSLSACKGATEVCDPSDPLCGNGGGTGSLSIADASATEGSFDPSDIMFTVTLSSALTSNVTVNYATSPGTAEADVDYQTETGMLTFPAGTTTQTITVALWPDVYDEGANETFTVSLSAASGATISDPTAIGTIEEDDSCALAGTISDGETVQGSLEFDDCFFDGETGVYYFDMYLLTLSSTTDVVIEQISVEVDSWLELWETDGNFLNFNDDDGPGPLDARIDDLLEPGRYLVVASSFDEDEVGAYDVSVNDPLVLAPATPVAAKPGRFATR